MTKKQKVVAKEEWIGFLVRLPRSIYDKLATESRRKRKLPVEKYIAQILVNRYVVIANPPFKQSEK